MSKQAPVEVFVRHCHFSQASSHKKRLNNFSREKCHDNLLRTLDPSLARITYFLDSYHPIREEHFIRKQKKFPVIEIAEGTEAGSFLKLLDYIVSLSLPLQTILYFLEDDYVHREGWAKILLEGFTIPGVDYITLYDHCDKYFDTRYQELKSKLYCTNSCHFRTTPSTTNTYAMRYGALLRDLAIHRAFSAGRKISADHEKFLELGKQGRVLISSIPGWATHAEPEFASPCTDWERLLIVD